MRTDVLTNSPTDFEANFVQVAEFDLKRDVKWNEIETFIFLDWVEFVEHGEQQGTIFNK